MIEQQRDATSGGCYAPITTNGTEKPLGPARRRPFQPGRAEKLENRAGATGGRCYNSGMQPGKVKWEIPGKTTEREAGGRAVMEYHGVNQSRVKMESALCPHEGVS